MTTPRRRAPATTPEARENQLISAAIDLAEKQLLEGTASAQVITHYLKAGSSRDRLERVKLEHETALLKARADSISSQDHQAQLMSEAMTVFGRYQGKEDEQTEDFYEE